MSDLVTDYRPDTAVIHRIVGVNIKEWWLQDCCGENNLIHGGVVIGIHCLRSHMPLVAIYWLSEFGDGAIYFKRSCAIDISNEVICGDLKR